MSDRIEAEILDVLGEEVVAAVDTPLVVIEGPKGDPGAAGKDGHSPVVTATKSGKTTTISVDGAAIATVEDGADGKPGAAGAGGITPTIGPNGTWHLGTTDTGKPSRGEKGEKGDPGSGADWAQNDPKGKGYVKNRPGGYLTDPIVTDADAFTITSAEDGGGVYVAMVAVESSAITLSDYVIGDGVVVDFGGQSYSLTWQSMEGFPACGAAVTGEAPDWSAAPFCIIAAFEKDRLQGYYVYLQNAVTSPIQVQIKKAKQTPVKIPTKYLESDVYIVKVTSKSNEQRPGAGDSDVSYDVTVSATYDDIVAAVSAGKIPILLGEPVLRDPVLRLVDIDTDTVDGATPKLTFGGAYFRQSDRLYGTCVVIYSTGEATCRRYDSSFVNRLKDVDDAMSDTSYNLVSNRVIKKYVDDHVTGGPAGAPGITPMIGANGNWYLGAEDTGKPSRGETGPQGAPGKDGSDATVTAASIKGALGYTPAAPGDIPVVPTAEISANTAARHSHVNKRVLDGITAAKTAAWDAKAGTAAATQSAAGLMSAADKAKLDGIERGANKTTVPTALKNPNALTIKIGGTTVTYDGSAAKTVTIADGSEVAY